MAVIQCKMCGGTVDLPQGVTSGECPYCGSLTTFPKINDEHKEQLYSRAEHFRRLNDFDKAVSAYETLLNEDSSDPEAYWGLVLSRFGIEYVEDPVSHERIPTCHRVQFESILTDADYQMALENSSGMDREIYEKEAQRIAEIQKGILAISSQEKPFDVFICYKETTEGGSRTKDSVVAQEIYYQLVNAGYKVFFARITLEDKLGQQYEPYIFAALNSAKVMLAIGSKKEYFEAVWVKNEWSRFLALMKKDRSKMLIPCYKDMDAYDIPQELSMLQSQDMSKIGFIQDLLRGIKKVVNPEESVPKAKAGADDRVTPLLKRISIFLVQKDWTSASQYCERVLDLNPESSQVYIYKLQAKNQLAAEDDLYKIPNLESVPDFQLAMRFADAAGKQRLNGMLAQQAKIREEEERKRREEALRQEEAKRRQRLEEIREAAENLIFQDDPLAGIRDMFSLFEENAGLSGLAEIRQMFVWRVYDHAVSLETENPDLAAELLGCIRELPEAVELRHGILSRNLRDQGMTPEDFLELENQYRKQAEEENDPFLQKLADECVRIAAELRKQEIYDEAATMKTNLQYFKAASLFSEIADYADSAAQAERCRKYGRLMINSVLGIMALIVVVIILSNIVTIGANLGITPCQIRKAKNLDVAGRMSEAADWYCKVAEKGNAEAQDWLAWYYIHSGSWQHASDWAEKAWAQGKRLDPGQLFKLAENLLDSNPGKASDWAEKAWAHGKRLGTNQVLLLAKNLIKSNPDKAVKWYKKAADQGHAEAQYQLGFCYANGHGVTENHAEAVKWFRKAAERGNKEAQNQLAECYYYGRDVTEDHAEAVKWFRKAAEQGIAAAQTNLGRCYYFGRGVTKNHAEAVKWYRKAAEQGNAEAQCGLGSCYYSGEGVAKDDAEAVKWYRKAAEQGNHMAQILLLKLGK